MLAFFVTSAFAASQYMQIQVEYGIKLQINGAVPKLTDSNGNVVQPFTFNGTTYVPIRAVANNMGATISYNSNTNTATIQSNGEDAKPHAMKALYYIKLASDYMDNLAQSSQVSSYDFSSEIKKLMQGDTLLAYFATIDSEYALVPDDAYYVPAVNMALDFLNSQYDAIIYASEHWNVQKDSFVSIQSGYGNSVYRSVQSAIDTIVQ